MYLSILKFPGTVCQGIQSLSGPVPSYIWLLADDSPTGLGTPRQSVHAKYWYAGLLCQSVTGVCWDHNNNAKPGCGNLGF